MVFLNQAGPIVGDPVSVLPLGIWRFSDFDALGLIEPRTLGFGLCEVTDVLDDLVIFLSFCCVALASCDG